MNPRFLLDSHIAVRWLAMPRKLSREQTRVLRDITRRGEPVAISAVSLIEIAVLRDETSRLNNVEILSEIESNRAFQIVPIAIGVAQEIASLGRFIRDPFDLAIVSTARVHHLTLITSDERVIDSQLVPVVA